MICQHGSEIDGEREGAPVFPMEEEIGTFYQVQLSLGKKTQLNISENTSNFVTKLYP